MKKLLSILFAFLILFSGMNISIATHICGGEIAAVKWSFSGKMATCGMERQNQESPLQKSITSNCCHNKIMVYSVDNIYSPSSLQIKEVTKTLLHLINKPINITFHSLNALSSLYTYVNPPGIIITSEVCLADICVFRI